LKFIITLLFLLNLTLISVSAQEKVYPNMPFNMFRLNNGLVMGFELQAGVGPTLVNDPKSGRFTGLTLLAGYQLDRNVVVSAGAGLSFYRQGTLVPLFLDIRYSITLSKLSPYLYADGGLLLHTDNLNSTTIFMNPGIGAQLAASNDLAFTFSSGFWLQRGEVNLNVFVNFKAGVRYRF
jgi:hypothetical protein